MSGKNSENPPKLIIQPGKMVTLSYTCNGEPCADMEVTIEAVGATEYQTTKHTTDKDGNVVVYLAEGSYKATTEKEIGVRNATSIHLQYQQTICQIHILLKRTMKKSQSR